MLNGVVRCAMYKRYKKRTRNEAPYQPNARWEPTTCWNQSNRAANEQIYERFVCLHARVFRSYPFLRLQAILHAAAAGAQRNVAGRQNSLGLDVLADLGQSVDETTDESDENGRYTAEGDGGVEEDQTAERNGELVQGTDHGVGRRRGDADGPGGGV
jgi:hypothetical protein